MSSSATTARAVAPDRLAIAPALGLLGLLLLRPARR
jgi:hypothetical protein